jgi:hypothetical protein
MTKDFSKSAERTLTVVAESGEVITIGLRMITSFIIRYLGWQAGNKFGSFAPDNDYPLTALLPRNAPSGISRP